MNKSVLITGATSGIGQACAHIFAKNGFRLVITGRRKDRLFKLMMELLDVYDAEVLAVDFDVSNRDEVQERLGQNAKDFRDVDILINNAGLAAGKDPIQSGNPDNWARMIDTNIKGILNVSEVIIPQMIQKNSGHIINVSSTAGKEVYPGGNVYCATKHAVEALTEGMRQDLLPHNIRVGRVSPGMVETEFSLVRFDGDKQKAATTYAGMMPLTAADVADAIFYMATRPPHVCINDLVILPTAQANSYLVERK
jgi:NADP-dependent 3-hydroxy acid dehydrogenase YdfG